MVFSPTAQESGKDGGAGTREERCPAERQCHPAQSSYLLGLCLSLVSIVFCWSGPLPAGVPHRLVFVPACRVVRPVGAAAISPLSGEARGCGLWGADIILCLILVVNAFWWVKHLLLLNTSVINISVVIVHFLFHCFVLSVSYYLKP